MKKLHILTLTLLFSLFSCDESDNCKMNHTHTHTPPKIEYIEKYCPNCNGVGQVKCSVGDRVILGILTFGPGALVETEECDMCRGTGIIKVRKLKQ